MNNIELQSLPVLGYQQAPTLGLYPTSQSLGSSVRSLVLMSKYSEGGTALSLARLSPLLIDSRYLHFVMYHSYPSMVKSMQGICRGKALDGVH